MATGKRYYWIKLKDSFMSSDEIDYLMSQPDGANYVVLYQMLCLKTINTNGCLVSKIGEMLIPYDAEKIQRECKWFPLSTVRLALTVYKQIGLIFENPDGTLSISDYQNMIGSETDWAAKNRRIRSNAANKELQEGHDTGHTSGHNVSSDGGENVPTEKEIEKDKEIVIPNGVQYERFCNIPLKQEDGWVDIGAVVRLAPIKDVKTMIYAFFELASRMPNVRLHIMGGVDDEDYAKECYALVEQLQLKNLIFTGRVDVVQYMQKLDFTILTSISEGQPLSVLESMAARRPCVTTEVGCCRELLEGAPGDTFGIAGYCVPPMYRQGLADAMEKMCASRARREEMGRIGQRRVDAYFHHEQMLANYRKMYDETAKEYHLE